VVVEDTEVEWSAGAAAGAAAGELSCGLAGSRVGVLCSASGSVSASLGIETELVLLSLPVDT
jgi:hypothetical protein